MVAPTLTDESSLSAKVLAVAAALRRGELVVAPTDTVYGIFADASDEKALAAVFSIKGRAPGKPIALIVAEPKVVEALIPNLSPLARKLVEAFWPGPLTLLAPTDMPLPPCLLKDGKIAVRCPDSDIARRVAAAMGGFVAVTSANISGTPPSNSPGRISRELRGKIDVIVEAGNRGSGLPSSVVEVEDGTIIVHREGAITASVLAARFPEKEVIKALDLIQGDVRS